MTNIEIANKIDEFITLSLKARSKIVHEEFIDIKNLKVNGDHFVYGDKTFGKTATRKILNQLQLRPKFLKYSDKMSEAEWNDVNTKIKTAYDNGFFGTAVFDDASKKYEFVDIYSKNKQKDSGHGGISITGTSDLICNALRQSQIEYDLGALTYNNVSNKFHIDLLSKNDTFSPLANDEWRKGHFFDFNSQQVNVFPMFERLVCTNGMTTRENAFRSNISQNKFNDVRIDKEINKAILTSSDKVEKMVEAQIQRLNTFNVSISEFLKWRKFLIGLDGGSQESNILGLMSDTPFYNAYNVNPDDMPRTWLKSANTGLSAYKMLNLATWLASHDDVTQFSNEAKKEIQLSAANYLFTKTHDLEYRAKHVKIEYPKHKIML